MSDIQLNISIKEENNILFKRCIRKLLDSTFIVGEKEEKLYSFISRESNRQDISDYLRMIGFDVLVDTNVRIAMLKPYEADEETVGLKRANVVTFSTEQYHILLVLWEIYLEQELKAEMKSRVCGISQQETLTRSTMKDITMRILL